MSALTIVLCIWAMVALCAILFIRGATSRYVRPPEAPKAPHSHPSRYSIAK